jgi:hypothetical protein
LFIRPAGLISAAIHNLVGSAVETEHVLSVLRPIRRKKPETASRPRGRIELVPYQATARGWRDRNIMNPAIWRGHPQPVLPSKREVRKVEHLGALPWQEVPAHARTADSRQLRRFRPSVRHPHRYPQR